MTRKVVTGPISTSDNLNPALRRQEQIKTFITYIGFIHEYMQIITNSFAFSRIIQSQNLHSAFLNV